MENMYGRQDTSKSLSLESYLQMASREVDPWPRRGLVGVSISPPALTVAILAALDPTPSRLL